jgi:hypothetical protein
LPRTAGRILARFGICPAVLALGSQFVLGLQPMIHRATITAAFPLVNFVRTRGDILSGDSGDSVVAIGTRHRCVFGTFVNVPVPIRSTLGDIRFLRFTCGLLGHTFGDIKAPSPLSGKSGHLPKNPSVVEAKESIGAELSGTEQSDVFVKSSVERLFPFVVRSRKLLVGREALAHNRRRLHSVLIATDISENSKAEILRDFSDYPVLQKYTAAQLEQFFGARNAKVIGFEKSSLAKSIYGELKECRLNSPPNEPSAS